MTVANRVDDEQMAVMERHLREAIPLYDWHSDKTGTYEVPFKDLLALIKEVQILRRALAISCSDIAQEVETYDPSRFIIEGNQYDACIERAVDELAKEEANG